MTCIPLQYYFCDCSGCPYWCLGTLSRISILQYGKYDFKTDKQSSLFFRYIKSYIRKDMSLLKEKEKEHCCKLINDRLINMNVINTPNSPVPHSALHRQSQKSPFATGTMIVRTSFNVLSQHFAGESGKCHFKSVSRYKDRLCGLVVNILTVQLTSKNELFIWICNRFTVDCFFDNYRRNKNVTDWCVS
jgi:hypothetical protein